MTHGVETDTDYKKLVFSYNADGLRVKKQYTYRNSAGELTTETTKYILHGKNIVHMVRGNDELHFWYDAQNRPAVVDYNGIKYGYVYNLQGDVVGLVNGTGTMVVSYCYDAWGKPLHVAGSLSGTLEEVQPFRYRGYVFDEETKWNYLHSRYYVPFLNRFINADYLIDGNLYAYTNNKPIMCIDADGEETQFIKPNVRVRKYAGKTNKRVAKVSKHSTCTVLFAVKGQEIDGNDTWYYVTDIVSPSGKSYSNNKGYVHSSCLSQVSMARYNVNTPPDLPAYDVGYGQYGEDAFAIQCYLYKRGYLKNESDCDGYYGLATTAAVQKLQEQINLSFGDFTSQTVGDNGRWTYSVYRNCKDLP